MPTPPHPPARTAAGGAARAGPPPGSGTSGRRAALRFVLVFATGAVLYEALFVGVVVGSAPFEAYLRADAAVAAGILRAFGVEVRAEGAALVFGPSVLAIRRGCDALQPAGLYALAVLAFPAPLRARLVAALAGVAALLALNVARIVALFLLHEHAPRAFELAHEALWPLAFALACLLMWWTWVQRLGGRAAGEFGP